jgi:hypothetical protein
MRDGRIRDWLSSALSPWQRHHASVPFSDGKFWVAFCTIIIAKPHKRSWRKDAKNELCLDFSRYAEDYLGLMRVSNQYLLAEIIDMAEQFQKTHGWDAFRAWHPEG